MAALGVSGHALILAHSGLLLLSPLRPPLFLGDTDSGDCGEDRSAAYQRSGTGYGPKPDTEGHTRLHYPAR
jgi:hypothetical protein